MRFQNFTNFAENVTQFFGFAVFWGENYGEKKRYKQKNLGEGIFGENFLGEFFYFSKISSGSFLYFTVCAIINFTCTRSNSEGVI